MLAGAYHGEFEINKHVEKSQNASKCLEIKKTPFVFLSHWYINGLLIPEIYVVRGKTYTFVVEGGDDKVRFF